MVNIFAFQAIDPGSIPGQRIFFLGGQVGEGVHRDSDVNLIEKMLIHFADHITVDYISFE